MTFLVQQKRCQKSCFLKSEKRSVVEQNVFSVTLYFQPQIVQEGTKAQLYFFLAYSLQTAEIRSFIFVHQ